MSSWKSEFDSEDINAVNRWGETRLYKASEEGNFDLVKSLVDSGADISIRTNEKTTPRVVARKKKHTEIENFLFTIEQEQLESSKLLEEQALKALNQSQTVKLEREKKEKEQSLKRKESEFRIWFYSYDLNETIGSVSFEELKQVYSESESDGMMVWSPNQEDWKHAHELLADKNDKEDAEYKKNTEGKLDLPTKEEKKILKRNEISLIKNDTTKGFLSKLIDGDCGLAKTYWLYGVVFSIPINLLMHFIISTLWIFIILLVYSVYQFFLLIGIWRAASRYEGLALWSYLAYIMVIFAWIILALSWMVILFSF